MNKHHNLPSIFVAMDFDSIDDAKNLALKIDPNKCGIKIGKELFTSSGPELVKWFHKQGFKTFLDLKYHDIPNTVSKACKSAARLGVSIVNVHALGGEKMMLSAKKGLEEIQSDTLLIAVTILKSPAQKSLQSIGLEKGLDESVKSLAQQAAKCRLDGIVCSALDLKNIKNLMPKNFIFVTPGVRLHKTNDDQKRVMTPNEAFKAGSTILVVGRPITEANDPSQILNKIYSDFTAN